MKEFKEKQIFVRFIYTNNFSIKRANKRDKRRGRKQTEANKHL